MTRPKRKAAIVADTRNKNLYDNETAVEEFSGSDSELPPVKLQKTTATKQRRPILENNDVRKSAVSNAIGKAKQNARFSAAQLAEVVDLVTDSESDAEVPNNKSPLEIPDDAESDVEVSNNESRMDISDDESDKFFPDDVSVDDEDNDIEAYFSPSDDIGSENEDDDTEIDFIENPQKKARTGGQSTKHLSSLTKQTAPARRRAETQPEPVLGLPPPQPVVPAQVDAPFDDESPQVDVSIASTQTQPVKKAPKAAPTYRDAFKWQNGIAEDLKPISTAYDAFHDMYEKMKELRKLQRLIEALHKSQGALKIGTMCSGTDSPILALSAFEHFCKLDGWSFPIHHAFSMEIVAFKQAFLALNFDPDVLFRNVCDLLGITEKSAKDVVDKFEMMTALGGMAVVPGDLDILIAGTCCVDFSIMNSKQKTLKAGGESGDTFFAMLSYAKVFRPRIIILENVAGAPWLISQWSKKKGDPHGFDDEFSKIDYKTNFVKLDTKDYYIPHTRTRGYMIAVNIEDLSENERALIDELLEEWEKLVDGELKRPASTPVELWLMQSDDPRLIHSRTPWVDDLEKSRKPPRWDACKVNYASYRHNLGLGDGRPLTSWGTDGFFVLPDFYQQKHSFGMTERVLDTIDISHTRGIKRGYDDRYYFRITELGQNVYRDKEQNKQGVASCQTPNAQQFLSRRGGRLVGQEALHIQGLSVDRLDISRLTQNDMQDLSGNAMTTTVVGAVTMAALTTFVDFLNFKGDRSKALSSATSVTIEAQKEKLSRQESSTWSFESLRVPEALGFTQKTRKLCYCENRELTKEVQFQKCTLCLHTTCTSCGKQPDHCYERLPPMAREDVRVFEKRLLQSLPMATKLASLSKQQLSNALDKFHSNNKHFIDGKTWDLTRARLQEALLSTVSFQSIRRSDIWEVFYESKHAKLILTISGTEVRWDMFVNAPEEPLGTELGKHLRQFPIAQMFCRGDDLIRGDFRIWRPKVHEFDATVSMKGPMVPVYEGKIGIVAKQETYQYTRCTLDIDKFDSRFFPVDIRGEYTLSTKCGQPFNCMWIQDKTLEDANIRISMSLDHELGHGDPATHSIVIADNTRRLEQAEYRTAKGTFESSFRFPNAVANRNEKDQRIESFTLSDGQKYSSRSVAEKVETSISVNGTWATFPGICLGQNDDHKTIYHQLHPDTSFPASQCDSQHTLFTCDAHMSAGMSRDFPSDQFILLTKGNEPVFFKDLKYLAQGGLIQDGHKEGGEWKSLVVNASQTPCQTCSPKSPDLLWALDTKNKLVPYEDPEQAAEYEKACKRCPTCILAAFRRNHKNDVEIVINGNPDALSHKALATLIPELNQDVKISTEYRVITDANANPKPKKVPFTIPLNQPAENRKQPENFKHGLRTQQQDALAWCRGQEEGEGKNWTATVVAEANLNALGYRLEARAVADTKISGGVLAFDVAFGKTPVMLALTQVQKAKDLKWAKEKQSKPTSIRLKATLVVVPDHLPGQWESEIGKFINSKLNVLVIKDSKHWNKQKATVRRFKEADIIVIGMSLLGSSPYLRDLANLAAVVELNKTSINKENRAKRAWRTKAAENIKGNMAELLANEEEFVKNQKTRYEASIESCRQNAAPVPSKRLVGAKYMENKEANLTTSTKKRKVGASNAETLDNRDKYFKTIEVNWLDDWPAVFEMFEFARLIIDEYTYLGDLEQAIPFIRSRSRWILSGTPDLATASDVFKMGRLIGAYVGTDDYFTASIEQWKKIYQDMTRAEDYQSLLANKSDAYSYNQMQVAQKFLDQFARKDEADIGHITLEEQIRLMYLTLYQWAIYKESEQRVSNLDFNQKVHVKGVGGHSMDIFKESARGCGDGREILIFRGAHAQPLPGLELELTDEVKTLTKAQKQKRAKKIAEKKRKRKEERAQRGETGKDDEDESDFSDVSDSEDEDNSEQVSADPKKAEQKQPKVVPAVLAEDMCKLVLEHRKSELAALLDDLLFNLRKATWLQNTPENRDTREYDKWQARATERRDPDLHRQLTTLIKEAAEALNEWYHFYRRTTTDLKAAEKRENKKFPNMPEGMVEKGNNAHLTQMAAALRQLISNLTKLTDSLESQIVSIRFMEALECVIDNGVTKCAGRCGTKLYISENFTLLTSCGHAICDDCKSFKHNTCPACYASYQPHQMITGAQLQKFNKSSLMNVDQNDLNYGEKVDCCMKLIQNVPEEDCVLLFVQFELIHNEVRKALDAHKIDYIDLKNSKKKSEDLVKYQSGNTKVLLLDIDDASASGSNLTCANHIIFLTPYFVKGSSSQDKWKATMTQATGRARRWGQEKVVHAYHFITAETIDVDIFQMRHRKKLIPLDDDESRGQLVALDDPDEYKGPLSSAIWHLLFRGHYA